MKNIRPLFSLLATTAVFSQAPAWADTAFNIANGYPFNSAVTYDDNGGTGNFPVVTAILSAPHNSIYNPGATLDGYTYNNWSYLAQDPTGSLDIFYSSSAAGPLANYPVPHVGDQVLVQGVWSPFSGIAEVANGSSQAINVFGGTTGNPPYTPSPHLTTIPVINVGTNSHGVSASGLSGALLQLNGVTISGAGANWAVHANVTGTITDQSNNSMTMFLWASSYSACGMIAQNGDPIPTGEVNMVGFISDFYNTSTQTTTPEFVPISIAVVPEPATIGLCGLGSVLAWICYRQRKKA